MYQCPSVKEWPLDKHSRRSISASTACTHRDSCQTCRECSGRQHTMLHRPDNASDSFPNDQPKPHGTQFLCANGRVVHQFTFPLTALVTVKADASQQRTRDLLDPSATISLITSRLANLLKIKRIRRSMDSPECVAVTIRWRWISVSRDGSSRTRISGSLTVSSPPRCNGLQPLHRGRTCLLSWQVSCRPEHDLWLGCERFYQGHGVSSHLPYSNICRQESRRGDAVDYTSEEKQAIVHFNDTHLHDADGWYRVQLTTNTPSPALVASRPTAYFKTNNLSSIRDAGTPLLSVCPSMMTWDMLRKFHISTCRKTAPKPSTYQCMVCQSFSMLPPKHQQTSCSMTSSCRDFPSILISPRSSTSFDFTVWACLGTSPKCSTT